jgi:hypothetical protein
MMNQTQFGGETSVRATVSKRFHCAIFDRSTAFGILITRQISRYMSRFVILGALTGCVATSTAETDPAPSFSVAKNYQQVYADILRGAKNCVQPGISLFPGDSMLYVEGQLFNELGYGEVVIGSRGMIPFIITTTRVAKEGAGARVTIHADYGLGYVRESWRNSITHWAKGELMCDQPVN